MLIIPQKVTLLQAPKTIDKCGSYHALQNLLFRFYPTQLCTQKLRIKHLVYYLNGYKFRLLFLLIRAGFYLQVQKLRYFPFHPSYSPLHSHCSKPELVLLFRYQHQLLQYEFRYLLQFSKPDLQYLHCLLRQKLRQLIYFF